MLCQRCKSAEATYSGQQACITTTPGVRTVREVRLCNACRGREWPTMDVDAPAVTVVESMESKWKETAEHREAIGRIENLPAEHREHFRQMFRISAVNLVEFSKRTDSPLPPEAEAFVREHLGAPPYPSMLEVWLQEPGFRATYEAAQGR